MFAKRNGLALQFAGEAAEIAEDVRGQRGFRPSLGAHRIAGFFGDDAGEFLDARFHRLGDAQQHAAALAGRHLAPVREGLVRGRDRAVHILCRTARNCRHR